MIWTFLTQDYWRDEVFRVFMAKLPLLEIVRLAPQDGQPPLYYFLLHFWMRLFGDNEVATRSLSLIFFELLLFVGYKLSQKLLPDEKHFGTIVSLFLLFNPLLVFYAFEARMYMMFIFLVTFSSYALWSKKKILWLLANLLGLYTHNFMGLVLASQIVWLIIAKKFKEFLPYLIVVFLSYLPWLPILVAQVEILQKDFWLSSLSRKAIEIAPLSLLTGYEGDPSTLLPLFSKLSLVLLIFILMGMVRSLLDQKDKKHIILFLSLWLMIPVALVIFVSLFGQSFFLARYLGFATIPLTILIVLSVGQKFLGKEVLVIIFLGLFLYLNQLLFPYRQKIRISSVVADIAQTVKKGDLISTHSLNFFETKYYFEKLSPGDYTKDISIKIYSPSGYIPYFVGKVLINYEDIIAEIPKDRRVFQISREGKLTIQHTTF